MARVAKDFESSLRVQRWRLQRMEELVERVQIELNSLHELCEKVRLDLRGMLADVTPPTIWYMRDNHTFLPLPLNVEEALMHIHDAMVAGSSHGMLCAGDGHRSALGVVHARGMDDWPRFEKDARAWLEKAVALFAVL